MRAFCFTAVLVCTDGYWNLRWARSLVQKYHDRFLIIYGNIIYHIGASLKDLAKKWLAFSIIEKDAVAILERISKVRI